MNFIIDNKLLSNNVLRVLFIISVFMLFFIAGVTYKQLLSLNKSQEWVVESHKIHIELEQLVSHLNYAETGQRGFLLTKDTAFLEPYFGARENVNSSFNVLKDLYHDNPGKIIDLEMLYFMIGKRFDLLEKNISRFAAINSIDDTLHTALIEGKIVMDKIKHQVHKMNESEMAKLKERERIYDKDIRLAPLTTLMVVLFSMLVFGLSFYKISKDNKYLTRINYELNLTKETFEHAEENALVGSYTWNMKTGEMTYSDNLFRLLGYKPHEFIPSFEKFLSFIHPDDRGQASEDGRKTFETRKLVAHEYRIITKDGQVKHMRSTGSFTGKGNKVLLVGTVQDISKDTELQRNFEEKNIELINSNKELNSFNYVASHDLQEPLRKIQVFMKRILEKEGSQLTETSKDYFQRTVNAALRMQKLIDALLNYSRASNSELQLTPVNLNNVIEEVKANLPTGTEEKKVIINSAKLPEVNAVNIQMQQLFTNLISNSIKYARPGKTPEINITYRLVDKGNIETKEMLLYPKYHQVIFSDNGIGFEQQYADKIFDLFQRLHTKTEYEGTGIGLAICKKIVKNHNGIITVEGRPGEGATFNIYLPA